MCVLEISRGLWLWGCLAGCIIRRGLACSICSAIWRALLIRQWDAFAPNWRRRLKRAAYTASTQYRTCDKGERGKFYERAGL